MPDIGACAPERVHRQAHAGAVRAAQHLSAFISKYKTDFTATTFMTLTKHKLAESVELESSAYMGATQLNNYLSLFYTRRDQPLIEAKFTPELLAGFE